VASTVLVKIGGKIALEPQTIGMIAGEMADLSGSEQMQWVFVHGGGVQVTRFSKTLGMEPRFEDGVRITTPEEMEVVDMVLAGRVNKELVRLLFARGLRAVGLSGSDGATVVGRVMHAGSLTGEVERVDPQLIRVLLDHGYVPVVSTTSMDGSGGALNINADSVAFSLAAALGCTHLLFLSDVPGVLKEAEVIPSLDSAAAMRAIGDGTISGGMIPKVESSLDALRRGVGRVIITDYRRSGDLRSALRGEKGSSLHV